MTDDFVRFNLAWWDVLTVPEPNSGCLLWLGGTTGAGYGLTINDDGGIALAHRVAYQRAFGTFDTWLNVCHRCDTRCCVNPDHLYLATQLENMREMHRKKRNRPRGSRTPKPDLPT